MQNIATVTTEVVALRAAEGQRKSKTRRFPPRPAEHVSLSFGIIISFSRDDCESPRIKVFDVMTGAKMDWRAKKKKKKCSQVFKFHSTVGIFPLRLIKYFRPTDSAKRSRHQ